MSRRSPREDPRAQEDSLPAQGAESSIGAKFSKGAELSKGAGLSKGVGPGENAVSSQGGLPRYARGELASELGILPLPDPSPEVGVLVERSSSGVLEVRLLGERAPGAVSVDFRSADFARRASEGKRGLLGRAVGLAKGEKPLVWDATAGLGRDAVRLAWMGARVVAFERDRIVRALLADGLTRGMIGEDPLAEAIESRFELRAGDAREFFDPLKVDEPPDVIYLDPMFPERGSALAKKEAQILGVLCGKGSDREEDAALFEGAEKLAPKRIVVKRPRYAPTLIEGREPAHRFEGKSVRYDLYLPQ